MPPIASQVAQQTQTDLKYQQFEAKTRAEEDQLNLSIRD